MVISSYLILLLPTIGKSERFGKERSACVVAGALLQQEAGERSVGDRGELIYGLGRGDGQSTEVALSRGRRNGSS